MEKLNKLRNENNYTYQAMADKLHISKTFYYQIENKQRNLSYKRAVEIAAIFKLKPDDIFYKKESK